MSAPSNSRIARDAAKYVCRASERRKERASEREPFHRSFVVPILPPVATRSSPPSRRRRSRQGVIKRRSECVSPMIQGQRRLSEPTNNVRTTDASIAAIAAISSPSVASLVAHSFLSICQGHKRNRGPKCSTTPGRGRRSHFCPYL